MKSKIIYNLKGNHEKIQNNLKINLEKKQVILSTTQSRLLDWGKQIESKSNKIMKLNLKTITTMFNIKVF